METNYQVLNGNWNAGFALDIHTKSSIPIYDENGNVVRFDTTRTELGEELYKLKYWTSENNDIKNQRVNNISDEINLVICSIKKKVKELKKVDLVIDCIIPIPPSKDRSFQPVFEIAKKVSELSNIPLNLDILKKIKSTSELKSIDEAEERMKVLENAFDIKEDSLKKKNVIIIDDLYRSGATLQAVTKVLKERGGAMNVIVLTVTKTRSKK